MSRRPLWIWPNLLSLDAPLVALAWFWIFKQVWLVRYHQPTLPWFLALAVWCIYVADRLMDSRGKRRESGSAPLRHRFHRQFRNPMKIALLAGCVGVFLLMFSVHFDPTTLVVNSILLMPPARQVQMIFKPEY